MTNLTWERLVQQHLESFSGATLRGFLILNLGSSDFPWGDCVDEFNTRESRWNAQIIPGGNDFHTIQINDLDKTKDEKGTFNFFVKEIHESREYIVFTYARIGICKVFNRLIYANRNLWKPWYGSRFLEGFNQYISQQEEFLQSNLEEFVVEIRDKDTKLRKGSSRSWIPRTQEQLTEQRLFHYRKFNELSYIKRGKFNLLGSNEDSMKLSLSDRGEFSLYSGNLLLFLHLAKKILQYGEHVSKILTRKVGYAKSKENIKEGILETIQFEKLEVLDLHVDSPLFEDWYDNLLKLLGVGYVSEEKIMFFGHSTTTNKIMAEIVDVETGCRIYLHASNKLITLAPTIGEASQETISKMLSMLQTHVDPTISIVDSHGTETVST